MDRPIDVSNCVQVSAAGWEETSRRDRTFVYDSLGQMTDHTTFSEEAAWEQASPVSFLRQFIYTTNLATGMFDTIGPDGDLGRTLTDAAGRVSLFLRGTMLATVTYYADDRVDTVTYGNDTQTKYTYDDARRLTNIRHEETLTGLRLHELAYSWTPDGLVSFINETDEAGNPSLVSFTYDNRNRLTGEVRNNQHPYVFIYTYDIAGNRTAKSDDDAAGVTTNYTYDYTAPLTYDSQGNRLVYSQTSVGGDPVEERWYRYDLEGRTDLVIRRIEGDEDPSGNQWYRGTRMYYNTSGRIWNAVSERWQVAGGVATNCERLSAMEYRYDATGRQRYLVRPLDPQTLTPYANDDGTWHDYDGDAIWGDYTVSLNTQTQAVDATDTIAHVPGMAQFDRASTTTDYLHGNLIGTTERMTDDGGALESRTVYTAFGEPIFASGPAATRYGYAGAWGYQQPASADPLAELGWLHVGERYYDPSSGRFMQRDPIGIRGGPNTYVLVSSQPVTRVDPDGLQVVDVTDEEAVESAKHLKDWVIDVVRAPFVTFYNFCVFWEWVQQKNRSVFNLHRNDENWFGRCGNCLRPWKFSGEQHLHAPRRSR